MSKKITVDYLNHVARQLATTLTREYKDINRTLKIYGVPRGGLVAAYALVAAGGTKTDGFLPMKVVEDINDADIIIDDLVDSGKTMDYYRTIYPEKPFHTLFGKPKEWIVFPWEETELASADDIPTRLLQFIGEDVGRGGLRETPERYLKAWKEFTRGYKESPESVLKVFKDGAEKCNEMILVKDIPIYSQCEHHLVPFFGVAHIAYIPDGKIVGLSKLSRVADIFARRLQVQERLTNQIADALEEHLEPKGVAVVMECRHLCMEARGIAQQGMITTTSAVRGVLMDNPAARAEFLTLIK